MDDMGRYWTTHADVTWWTRFLPRCLPGPDLFLELAGKLFVIVVLVPARLVSRRLLCAPCHRSAPSRARGAAGRGGLRDTQRRGRPTPPNTSTPRARLRVHAGRLDATRRRRANTRQRGVASRSPPAASCPAGEPPGTRVGSTRLAMFPRLAASLLPLVCPLYIRYGARVRKHVEHDHRERNH